MIASTPLKAQRCVLSVWRPQRVVASKPFTPGQSLTYVQSVCSPATHTHTAEVDCSQQRTSYSTHYRVQWLCL